MVESRRNASHELPPVRTTFEVHRPDVRVDVYMPSAGGLPPRPPAEGSPLVSGTLVPIHLAAILFGIAAAVEALLFVWTRRNESGAMDDGKPVDHTARSPPQRT